GEILDVRSGPDGDGADVSAQDRAVPHARQGPDHDVADERRIFRDEGVLGDPRRDPAIRLDDRHQSTGSTPRPAAGAERSRGGGTSAPGNVASSEFLKARTTITSTTVPVGSTGAAK